MTNNWILQEFENDPFFVSEDFDDYGFGSFHRVSIGDEVEAEDEEYPQHGVVVGIIRNRYGLPACYKLVCLQEDDDAQIMYDYVSPESVTFVEPCGSSAWSIGRFGYEFVEEDDGKTYFINKETGDVIPW